MDNKKGNKNLVKIAIVFGIIFCLFSCGKLYNPKERNRFVFNDNINAVADNIIAMNVILIKTQKQNYIYAIDSNQIYINENKQYASKLGLITDSLLFENKALSFINSPDRKRFIGLAKCLNDNYLSRCDIENGHPIYMYRADIFMGDSQTDLFRYVVFANSEKEIDLNRYKILDKHRNLYLLANKDAKIWSSE